MVAKITGGKDIVGLLNYNEIKVNQGMAELILANRFMTIDPQAITFKEKEDTFKMLLDKNSRVEKGTFHVSLNFDTSEKPSKDKLENIASDYMEKMGFGKQPYLVYQHNDVHHSHIHIVSVKVDSSGKKINEDFFKLRSEKARKEIEIDYHLLKASEKQAKVHTVKPVVLKADYGKEETKSTITSIVRSVVENYTLCSLKELQLSLSQFNIKAEHIKGKNGQKEYEGLKFYITNENGTKLSAGIKASAIYGSPTLQQLQKKFDTNTFEKKELKENTKQSIRIALKDYAKISLNDFKTILEEKHIKVNFAEGKQGVFGISFIDNKNKVVFSGSELGKEYSWNQLKHKFSDQTVNLKERNDLMKKINTGYNNIRKEKYYFESSLIKNLKSVDLVSGILKENPSLTKEKILEAAKTFIQLKQSKLPEILAKEQAYFQKNVQSGLTFINANPSLSLQEKTNFLNRMMITVAEENGATTFTHIKGGYAVINMKQPLKDIISFQLGTLKKIQEERPFNKIEKKFIQQIESNGKDYTGMNLFNFKYQYFRPFLIKEKRSEVDMALTYHTLQAILQKAPKGNTAKNLVETLQQRGLILTKTNDSYHLHYYKFPESRIKPDPALVVFLKTNEIIPKGIEINKKYELLTKLYQHQDSSNLSGAIQTVKNFQKRDPQLYQDIIRDIKPQIDLYNKDKGKPAENDLIGSIIQSINKNANPDLKTAKIKALTDDNEYEQGVNALTAILEGGNETPSKAVKSHHSKNKKKRGQNI